MLSGTILSFWIGVNHWSAESIDLEGFSLLVTGCWFHYRLGYGIASGTKVGPR